MTWDIQGDFSREDSEEEGLPTRHTFLAAVNEHEISQVDHRSNTLAGNKDGILAIERIGENNETPPETHVPERKGNTTLGLSFRDEPLEQPP